MGDLCLCFFPLSRALVLFHSNKSSKLIFACLNLTTTLGDNLWLCKTPFAETDWEAEEKLPMVKQLVRGRFGDHINILNLEAGKVTSLPASQEPNSRSELSHTGRNVTEKLMDLLLNCRVI